ncbi:MAG TPA: efflux RND transporter permease subunit, partial [Pseudomonadales bacterium]|nr:efflux RND transporter permease subunit [Pseudomonadales bacterium]
QNLFERGFDSFRLGYQSVLQRFLAHPKTVMGGFFLVVTLSMLLLPWLGEDFFPSVDAGQIKLHLRARSGTRIEETAALCDQIEAHIKTIIPAFELESLADNIGLPYSGINLSYSTSAPIGPGDADIMISLKPGHQPTKEYVQMLRSSLSQAFPSTSFAFLPADIVSQILNFGLPAPFDIQITGYDLAGNREVANQLLAKVKKIPGAVDVRIQQAFDYPQINLAVDRVKSAQMGFTQRDIASNLLISLSGSFQTSPSFWVDNATGVQYSVSTMAPQYRLADMKDLENTPLSNANGSNKQLLGNLANISRSAGQAVVSHYNVKPTIDIFGSVEGIDLGSVNKEIQALVNDPALKLPKGTNVVVRGQVQTMQNSFQGLSWGILGAIVLVYLLI